MTSVARFFVKHTLHKKCGVSAVGKKVSDFFDTLHGCFRALRGERLDEKYILVHYIIMNIK